MDTRPLSFSVRISYKLPKWINKKPSLFLNGLVQFWRWRTHCSLRQIPVTRFWVLVCYCCPLCFSEHGDSSINDGHSLLYNSFMQHRPLSVSYAGLSQSLDFVRQGVGVLARLNWIKMFLLSWGCVKLWMLMYAQLMIFRLNLKSMFREANGIRN